jgi:hypothetical protein
MPNLANLDRNAHQKLRVNDARALSVFRDLNMCPVVPSEIARLVIEYPIAFAKNGDSGQYVCVRSSDWMSVRTCISVTGPGRASLFR